MLQTPRLAIQPCSALSHLLGASTNQRTLTATGNTRSPMRVQGWRLLLFAARVRMHSITPLAVTDWLCTTRRPARRTGHNGDD